MKKALVSIKEKATLENHKQYYIYEDLPSSAKIFSPLARADSKSPTM